MKRVIVSVMVCIIVVYYTNISANAKEESYNQKGNKYTYDVEENLNDMDECKEILLSVGTPQNVIDKISDSQLQYIASNLAREAIYESMNSFVCEDMFGKEEENTISTYAVSTLSEELIDVTVLSYRVCVNGEWQYIIFPSFKWLKPGYSIDNDSFAFALYSGWEVVPGYAPKITLNLVNSYGVQQTRNYGATDASQYGFCFNFQYGIRMYNGWHEGNTMFYAKKKNENATAGISVKYIYDNSKYFDASYGISIGVASVSVSTNDKDVYVYARNLKFYNTYK